MKVEKTTTEAVPTTELPPGTTEDESVTFIVDDETGTLPFL